MTYDKTIDKELNQEQIPQIVLILAGKRAQNTRRATIKHGALASGNGGGIVGRNLLVVLAHQDHAGHEGAEYLREDVVGDFFPWEALPIGEAEGDGLVHVLVEGNIEGDMGSVRD